jgi:hypothetical protein
MRVNLRAEEPLTGRARVPGAPQGRSRSQWYIFVVDQGRLWASGTIRRLPDEDAIPPSAGSGSRLAAAGSDVAVVKDAIPRPVWRSRILARRFLCRRLSEFAHVLVVERASLARPI